MIFVNLGCAVKKVGELTVTLLDSKEQEMVFCSCGVLVNLTGDPNHRDILTQNGGVKK